MRVGLIGLPPPPALGAMAYGSGQSGQAVSQLSPSGVIVPST